MCDDVNLNFLYKYLKFIDVVNKCIILNLCPETFLVEKQPSTWCTKICNFLSLLFGIIMDLKIHHIFYV